MALECLLKNCCSGRGLPELHYTCPQIYFEEYLFEKHVFYFFWQKDSRNLAKNLRHGCHFCVHATSRTFSVKADFFKLVFVTFVLWAIIPGVSAEISEKRCQNWILRFQKCFLTFFSNIYNSITFSEFGKNTFRFLAKRFHKGCRTCLYESNRDFWGRKFLLIKISTSYDWSEFRMKILEHLTKNGWSCRDCNLFVKVKFLRTKTYRKELVLPLVSDFQREILDLLAKNVLVCVLVCVGGVGTANTTFYMSEETFWENTFFENIVVSYFFLDFGREYFDFLAWNFGGFVWTAQKKKLGNKTFLKKFQNFRVIDFWSKKIGVVAETAFTCLAEVFESFFWQKCFSIVNLAHLVSGFGSSGGKFSYRGVRKLHSTCLHMKSLMKNQCFEQM